VHTKHRSKMNSRVAQICVLEDTTKRLKNELTRKGIYRIRCINPSCETIFAPIRIIIYRLYFLSNKVHV